MSFNRLKSDYVFAITVFLLSLFGIVMISSSSVVISAEHFGNNYGYAINQLISLVIGAVLMVVTYNIDYRIWRKYSFAMLLITIILLILVFIPGIGKESGGAHRWFMIGPKVFQPSEIVKLTFIIYLASWMEKKGEDIKQFSIGFIPFACFLGIIGLLIMLQPDLGTTTVIVASAVAIYFSAGATLGHLGLLFGSAITLLVVLIKSAPYRMQRLMVFLNPAADIQGAGYHINQALLAIGSGGLWGLGFGRSHQKYLYLPQTHTDSIFAIIAEELGFIRSSLVIFVFLFLAYRGFKIAKEAPDTFSRLVVIGIMTWILIQAFVNIAAMLSLVPLTGVPLPFISYGGSSLIVLLAAVGIILNISKNSGSRI